MKIYKNYIIYLNNKALNNNYFYFANKYKLKYAFQRINNFSKMMK